MKIMMWDSLIDFTIKVTRSSLKSKIVSLFFLTQTHLRCGGIIVVIYDHVSEVFLWFISVRFDLPTLIVYHNNKQSFHFKHYSSLWAGLLDSWIMHWGSFDCVQQLLLCQCWVYLSLSCSRWQRGMESLGQTFWAGAILSGCSLRPALLSCAGSS